MSDVQKAGKKKTLNYAEYTDQTWHQAGLLHMQQRPPDHPTFFHTLQYSPKLWPAVLPYSCICFITCVSTNPGWTHKVNSAGRCDEVERGEACIDEGAYASRKPSLRSQVQIATQLRGDRRGKRRVWNAWVFTTRDPSSCRTWPESQLLSLWFVQRKCYFNVMVSCGVINRWTSKKFVLGRDAFRTGDRRCGHRGRARVVEESWTRFWHSI